LKIYTKTGDTGETSFFDNTRVSKADARVDAYGEVDELNACLGAARAAGLDPELSTMLVEIQKELFAIGARLADPSHRIAARVSKRNCRRCVDSSCPEAFRADPCCTWRVPCAAAPNDASWGWRRQPIPSWLSI
jgi:cob(I)alamin adenosyltransferase